MAVLRIDLEAIGRNTETVAQWLHTQDIALVGVTKGCLGEPRVGAAMLAGGAVALADTRDASLRRLRRALPGTELHRIYLPSLSSKFEPGDITYVSSAASAAALAATARQSSGIVAPRQVMLHIETGDLREGVPPELVPELAATIMADPRLELVGVATNYACFAGGPAGIRHSAAMVAQMAVRLREAGLPVARVSGGNSSLLWLLAQGEKLPPEITELRCGEALLLGQDGLLYEPLPGCSRQACLLRAEVLEEYTKPASGRKHRRLVLGIGRQDLGEGAVNFLAEGLEEIGRSSDYLVIEKEVESAPPHMGDSVDMIPSYEALVAAWTSPFVDVKFA